MISGSRVFVNWSFSRENLYSAHRAKTNVNAVRFISRSPTAYLPSSSTRSLSCAREAYPQNCKITFFRSRPAEIGASSGFEGRKNCARAATRQTIYVVALRARARARREEAHERKRENLGTSLITRPLFSPSHAPCLPACPHARSRAASRPRRHPAILPDLNGRHERVTAIILCR